MKEYDKSSPKLYQALCTGEHLKNVTIKWYRINKQGSEEHYFSHVLEDAIVVSITPSMPVAFLPENEPYRHMEEVSFTYKKIKWTWSLTVSNPKIPGLSRNRPLERMQHAGLLRALAEQSGILRIAQVALLLARLHYTFMQSS